MDKKVGVLLVVVYLFVRAESCPSACICRKVVSCRSKGLTEVPSGFPSDTLHIDLQDNPIKCIRETDFAHLHQLQGLALQGISLVRIDEDSFKELKNLQYLLLSNNMLTSIAKNTFRSLSQLRTLTLNNNWISAIHPEAFNGLANLKQLDMSKNNLKAIRGNVFGALTQLENLDLSGNNISSLHWISFSQLTHLTRLNIASNKLTFIQPHMFPLLGSLGELDLSGNQLIEIKGRSFCKLPVLSRLYLNDNRLTTLHSDTFSGLTFLNKLQLDRNVIKTIDEGTFSPLVHLRVLHLERNKLTTINRCTFSQLQSVRFMDLNSNTIQALQPYTFKLIKSLQVLLLAQNRITKIENNAFPMTLEELDISNNDLTSLQLEVFASLRQLRILNLFGNRVECSCAYMSLLWSFNKGNVMTTCFVRAKRVNPHVAGILKSDTHFSNRSNAQILSSNLKDTENDLQSHYFYPSQMSREWSEWQVWRANTPSDTYNHTNTDNCTHTHASPHCCPNGPPFRTRLCRPCGRSRHPWCMLRAPQSSHRSCTEMHMMMQKKGCYLQGCPEVSQALYANTSAGVDDKYEVVCPISTDHMFISNPLLWLPGIHEKIDEVRGDSSWFIEARVFVACGVSVIGFLVALFLVWWYHKTFIFMVNI